MDNPETLATLSTQDTTQYRKIKRWGRTNRTSL